MDNNAGNWVKLTQLERMKFYERAKKAFVIVATVFQYLILSH